MLRKIVYFLSVTLALLSTPALADKFYVLNPELSSIAFATIKKQYVIEPAVINTLQGSLEKNGQFSFTVDLAGIRTGISIRDSRLNKIFFESNKYPTVAVKGQIARHSLRKGPHQVVIPVEVTMYGQTKTVDFPVVVLPSRRHIMVSSTKPVIIRAADFNIPAANLVNLAATVGGIKISNQVPIFLSLVFDRE